MTPPKRRPAATSARRVAFEVLRAVRENDAYANLLLPGRIRAAGLSRADAAFATELTYGTLRGRGTYDRVIELVAARALSRIDPDILDALRLGAHQLLALGTPPHAAVGETVALVRKSGTGFVNGVLRSISRLSPEEWRARAVADLSGNERLAVEHSHPDWIVHAFRDALDAEGASHELESLLAADNGAPGLRLAGLPGFADPTELGEPGDVSPIAARWSGGDPAESPAVAAGHARVQDEGSQLAALALSRARPVVAGERWLDLCAGPGGKAAVLAAEARIGGAGLLANEILPARAGLVRRAVAIAGDAVAVVEGDGRRFAEGSERFDRILLDAPCSGLGALRRRPEARWRKLPEDLDSLLTLQAELLDAAVAALAPGGLLAYVTCSPHLPETRDQIAAALARHPGLTTIDTPAVLARIATRDLALPPGSAAQLWPHRHGTDAMFVQLLTR